MEKKKILIIDDEEQLVEFIKLRLEANGYEVDAAHDGNAGLEKAKEGKPDLILLDIMMPEKDGYTMLQDLKADADTRAIPVIMITAKPDMRELFELEGIDGYLTKPFSAEDLLPKIAGILEKGE